MHFPFYITFKVLLILCFSVCGQRVLKAIKESSCNALLLKVIVAQGIDSFLEHYIYIVGFAKKFGSMFGKVLLDMQEFITGM